mmetsp:Transcript_18856/g.38394  ORF Transcript_18856/g.38394 Transcript_18856/m.38394 type:complete len:289 (+) Transcript_18856:403-1269(+)
MTRRMSRSAGFARRLSLRRRRSARRWRRRSRRRRRRRMLPLPRRGPIRPRPSATWRSSSPAKAHRRSAWQESCSRAPQCRASSISRAVCWATTWSGSARRGLRRSSTPPSTRSPPCSSARSPPWRRPRRRHRTCSRKSNARPASLWASTRPWSSPARSPSRTGSGWSRRALRRWTPPPRLRPAGWPLSPARQMRRCSRPLTRRRPRWAVAARPTSPTTCSPRGALALATSRCSRRCARSHPLWAPSRRRCSTSLELSTRPSCRRRKRRSRRLWTRQTSRCHRSRSTPT